MTSARRVSWRALARGCATVLMPLSMACDGLGSAPPGTLEVGRDSAGVRIVENGSAVGWPGGRGVEARTDLEIGSAGGAGADVFGNVVALDVDDAGRIYVLDQQAGQVRVFDDRGRHVTTFGQPGSGPGELGPGAAAVFVGGDGSVTVPDVGNARVTRYRPNGTPDSWPVRLERGVPVRWDRLRGGQYVAQLRAVTAGDSGAPRDALVLYGEDGAVVDTLVLLPAGTSVSVGSDGLPAISLFQPEPLWDVAGDGTLAWAMNSEYEVRRHTPDGALATLMRRDAARRDVSQADRRVLNDLVGDMLVDQGVPPAGVQAIIDRMSIAERFPALAAVHAASDGGVWVQRVRLPSDTEGEGAVDPMDLGAREWDVFDAAGRWLGTIRLPERFTLMALRDEALYGVVRDQLDVQRVVRLRLGMSGGA